MSIKKHIPNLFTLGNLLCGTLATIFAVQGKFEYTALFVVLGIVFDFFDGFLARLLGVSGELGKQLDSLADMVTSGVAPGIVMFMLLYQSFSVVTVGSYLFVLKDVPLVVYLGLLLTLGACYRLAKFNLDTRQSDSFIGMPTPAMSLFIVSLPLIQSTTDIEFIKEIISNSYVLIGITLLLTYLMNAEIPLLSLKFKNYGFNKENIYKYLLILISVLLIITLKYVAVPLIIVAYIALSIINNLSKKKHAV